MATVTLKGNPFHLAGTLPAKGAAAPAFTLVKQDLSQVTNKDFAGKTLVLLTVPSLDTGVCALETKKFNEKAAAMPGVTVLVASSDLPFAIKRFCGAENITNVVGASSASAGASPSRTDRSRASPRARRSSSIPRAR
jgi:thiol peroxidase